MDIIILIVIIFCVFGGVGWGYRSNWQGGWVAPSNLLFVIAVVILLVWLLRGRV